MLAHSHFDINNQVGQGGLVNTATGKEQLDTGLKVRGIIGF